MDIRCKTKALLLKGAFFMKKNICKLFYNYSCNCKKVVYLCNVETSKLLLKTKNIMSAKVYSTQEIASFDFTIYYASASTAGYGHKRIVVDVDYNGERKEFKSTTNDMPGYDDLQDLEGQEKYEALFELVEYDLSGRIAEWIDGLEK